MKNNILLLLSLLFLATACGKKETKKEEQKEEIPTVKIAEIGEQNIAEGIVASGVLASKAELKLAFKTGGMIKKMHVKEGQFVKEGQLLAELDLSEIDAQVNQAKIGLNKVQRDLERVQKLYDDQAATQTNLQDAGTAVDMAKQQVQTAVFNQKLSKIYAPAAGRILRKIAEEGELIVPFSPALILGTGNSAFIVSVGLTDRDIVRTKIGMLATIELDAYPNETFSATVTQIAQAVNPATGTYEVELQLKPTNKTLISGFVAHAMLMPNEQNSSLVVPISALVGADDSQATVFVFDPTTQQVTQKQITIGKINGNYVALLSGLEKHEKVVTVGGGFLRNKQRVIVSQ